MANFSNFLENKIIDHMLRGVAYTVPTNIYVALFTATAGLEANSPHDEVTGGDYKRKVITLATGGLGALNDGQSVNVAAVTFDQATAAWGTVNGFALVDHENNTNWGTGVNVLMWGNLTTPRAVGNTDTFSFPAESIEITID
jgi:hypothetical protein